jgi:hypothetical protein
MGKTSPADPSGFEGRPTLGVGVFHYRRWPGYVDSLVTFHIVDIVSDRPWNVEQERLRIVARISSMLDEGRAILQDQETN